MSHLNGSNCRPTRSSVPAHTIASWPTFETDLRRAVHLALPSSVPRYHMATIIAITWSNNNIPSVIPLRDELLSFFSQKLGFQTHTYIIKTTDNNGRPLSSQQASVDYHREIGPIIARFDQPRVDSPKRLIVLYYSGHSDSGAGHALRIYGAMNQRQPSGPVISNPFVLWAPVAAETLLILDSCEAGIASTSLGSEMLAGVPWGVPASAAAAYSFTRFLIDSLKRHAQIPITVGSLYAHMMRNAKDPKLCAVEAQPLYIRSPDKAYAVLLHKIPTRATEISVASQPVSDAKVIVTVTVAGLETIPDTQQWTDWLTTNIPPNVRGIDIVCSFESNCLIGRTVMISLPTVVWAYLPDRLAYVFVAHQNSRIAFAGDKVTKGVSKLTLSSRCP